MQQCTRATLGWRISTIAASVFVASTALAASPLSSKDQPLDATAAGMTVAALNPPMIGPGNAETDNTVNGFGPTTSGRSAFSSDKTIVGVASFYDDPGETASGELYDPNAFTAAAQLKIRDEFGGIGFGKNYRAAYGVAEYEGKKIILKFNDVGPLRPGRKFDLSRAAMTYFGGLEKGLLPDFKVTPLPLGHTYLAGPVTDEQLAALQLGHDAGEWAIADAACTQDHRDARLALLQIPSPAARPARLHIPIIRLSRILHSAGPLRRVSQTRTSPSVSYLQSRSGKRPRLHRAVGARVAPGSLKVSVRGPSIKSSRTRIRISRL